MTDKKPAETPETFVSLFLRVAGSMLAAPIMDECRKVAALLTVREGFPRGAAYTVHKSADKHANASAAVERTASGFDLILSNMTGARAEDAVYRLAAFFAVALYPAVKAEGKSKANHRTAERNALVKALGITYANGSATFVSAAWEPIRALMPSTRYAGSVEPNNPRGMFAFIAADAEGKPLKRRLYLSLRKDGKEGDAEFVSSLYSRHIIAGPVKNVPAVYAPPVQVASVQAA